MIRNGLLIELSRRQGQWRVRVTKPGGLVQMPDGDEREWISAPYMDKAFALEQVDALIDTGGLR
jgi:hypothetical protein